MDDIFSYYFPDAAKRTCVRCGFYGVDIEELLEFWRRQFKTGLYGENKETFLSDLKKQIRENNVPEIAERACKLLDDF